MLKNNQLMKMKIVIYLIFALLCFLLVNINVKAFNGNDIANVIFTDTWYDYINVPNLNEKISIHKPVLQGFIDNDLISTNTLYYNVDNIEYSSSNETISYDINYFNNIEILENKSMDDVYISGKWNDYFSFQSPLLQWDNFSSTMMAHTRRVTFNYSDDTYTASNIMNNSAFGLKSNIHKLQTINSLVVAYPNTFYLMTNIPSETINSFILHLATAESTPDQPMISIDGNSLIKGNSYVLGNLTNIIGVGGGASENDTTAPLITLNGDSEVIIKEKSSYNDLGAVAIDNREGDISSNILVTSNLNTNIPGTYQVTYSVCDSSNNCSQAIRNVIVDSKYVELDLTGKYAVLFYFKDWSKLTPNSLCSGECFKYDFKYKGYFKYGTVELPYNNSLIYSQYVSEINNTISFEKYQLLSMYHDRTIADFKDYAVLFYISNKDNVSKIMYDVELFNYIIFDNQYSSSTSPIDYIDGNGNNNQQNIPGTPSTDIDYISTEDVEDMAWYEYLYPSYWVSILIEKLIDTAVYLFVPVSTTDNFITIKDTFINKFSIVSDAMDIWSAILGYDTVSNSPPLLTIDWPEMGFNNAQIIDFSFYSQYRETIFAFIKFITFGMFTLWAIKKLPAILGGGGD